MMKELEIVKSIGVTAHIDQNKSVNDTLVSNNTALTSISNQLSLNSNLKTLKPNQVDDLLKNPQIVGLIHNQIKPIVQICYNLEEALQRSKGRRYVVSEEYFNGIKNTFRYKIYENFTVFKNEYNTLNIKHFHELLKTHDEISDSSSGPGRLVFDIDITEKLFFNNYVHNTFDKDFEESIKLTFSKYYTNVDINRLEFVWQTSEASQKYSRHLTVKNAIFVDFRIGLHDFYKLMLHTLSESNDFYYFPTEYFLTNSKFLDTNVAHSVQFRMSGSSKIQGNPLIIDNPNYCLEDTLVRPMGCMRLIDEQNVGLLNESGQLFIKNLTDQKFKRAYENKNQVDTNNLTEGYIISLIEKLSVDRAEETFKWRNSGACLKHLCATENVFQAWIKWSRLPEKYHNVTEKEYRTIWESFKPSDDWRWNSHFLLNWAVKDSPDEMRDWLSQHPDIKVKSTAKFRYQPYKPPRHCRIKINHIDQERINPYDMNKIIELVKSKMDSGKTYQLFELIMKNNIKSAVFTSARESFAISFYDLLRTRMNDPDLNVKEIPDIVSISLLTGKEVITPGYIEFSSAENPTPKRCYLYNEIADWSSVPENSFIVIQMESLWKLKIKPPQLFVCDECTSCISQFSSRTMKWLTKSWAMYEWLIRSSSKIIFMDAFIDYRVIDVLLSCRDNDIIYVQWNRMQRGSRRIVNGSITGLHAYKFLDDMYLTERMVHYAQNHWDLYIVCGSKAKAELVYNMLSCIGPTLLHTSDTTDEDRPKLRNVNNLWTQYRFVIITSTITNGIDFTQKHFDAIFCFGDSRTCTVRDTWQMIGRVRFVRQGYLFYSHHTIGDKKPTKYQTIKQIIINKVGSVNSVETELKTGKILQADYHLTTTLKVIEDACGKSMCTYVDDCLTRIHIRNTQEINMSRNYYDEIFSHMLQDQGISCQVVEDTLPYEHPFKEDFFDTIDYLKERREAEYERTPSITPQQADEYQKNIENRCSNYTERSALEKYHFEKYIKDDVKSETNYKLFKFFTGNKVKLLNGLRELRGSIPNTFMSDYNNYNNIVQSRIYFDQETIVRVFCNLVGLPNTITQDATFNTLEFGDIHFQLGQKAIYAFCMASRIIKTIQMAMSVFGMMLYRWTGTRLKSEGKQETTGERKRYTEYTLKVPNKYRTLISLMKPLENKEINMPLEKQQLQSIHEQLDKMVQSDQIVKVDQASVYPQPGQLNVLSQLIQTQSEIRILPIISQSTILELLVDFGLKYSKSPLPIPPLHLTNCIRQTGYQNAYKNYKILISKVTADIDKYLSSFNIDWKSLNIKPTTLFHNIITKNDKT